MWSQQLSAHELLGLTVYPIEYEQGCMVLSFVGLYNKPVVVIYYWFIHVLQGYFTGTGEIILCQRMPEK